MNDHPAAMSFEEARRICASFSPGAEESRPLAAALGCVLAEPVLALRDIPHEATSAMDGWAVAEPAPGGSPSWELVAQPGRTAVPGPLPPGSAMPVVTGSPVPSGTWSVLRNEHGIVDGEAVDDEAPVSRKVPGGREESRARPGDPGAGEGARRSDATRLSAQADTQDLRGGRNIRAAGAEARAGESLLPSGSRLTPLAAAAAAAAGHDQVRVVPRPSVAVIATGDEVISRGVPGPGEVRDVFALTLPALVEDAGGIPRSVRRCGDDADALQQLLTAEAPDAHVVLITGGTAHSEADMTRQVLERLGAEILIDSVQMRPGHPALLARLPDGPYVLGLPGNPLAGFTALAVLAVPLIRRLAGLGEADALRTEGAVAAEALTPARTGTRLVPVLLRDGQTLRAGHDRPHMMRGLAAAPALAVVPPAGIEADAPVQLIPLPGQR